MGFLSPHRRHLGTASAVHMMRTWGISEDTQQLGCLAIDSTTEQVGRAVLSLGVSLAALPRAAGMAAPQPDASGSTKSAGPGRGGHVAQLWPRPGLGQCQGWPSCLLPLLET